MLESLAAARASCPHCASTSLYRHGCAHSLQRYRCRDCGKTFNALTGTPLARLRHRDLAPVLDRDVLLVTDGNAVYRYFALEAGISHEAVNLRAGVRTRRAVHVQNVNAYHSRLHQWLSRFNGVATRYLPHYLAWRQVIDASKLRSPAQLLKAAIEPFHS